MTDRRLQPMTFAPLRATGAWRCDAACAAVVSRFIPLALAVTLGACAAPYSPPPSAKAARIRVLSAQTGISSSVRAVGYATGRCEAPMDLGMVGGIARWQAEDAASMPGSILLGDKTYFERNIPAGSPYLISVRGLFEGKLCVISSLLHPVAGQDYELEYSWSGGQCRLLAFVVSETGGSVTRSPMRQEKAPPRKKGFS